MRPKVRRVLRHQPALLRLASPEARWSRRWAHRSRLAACFAHAALNDDDPTVIDATAGRGVGTVRGALFGGGAEGMHGAHFEESLVLLVLLLAHAAEEAQAAAEEEESRGHEGHEQADAVVCRGDGEVVGDIRCIEGGKRR